MVNILLKTGKDAAALAIIAITNQPELTHGVGHGVGAAVEGQEAPHVTHDMRHIATSDTTANFCNVCGKWSKRNAHSKLSEVCSGKCKWTFGLKLLRHGILPVQGAKLPASMKAPPGPKN